jgi:aryl-alcohol dehydrogenase-like predicted oxidoreductase
VHKISDLQIEYSLVSRGPEAKIFPALAELGIGVTAYGVLSRGLLSGSRPGAAGDFRTRMPRFAPEHQAQNARLVNALAAFAVARNAPPAAVAIAWALAKRPFIVPVVGARNRAQLNDALRALELDLSPSDIQELEQCVPAAAVAGTRYDAHQMRMLDSER